MQMRGHRGDSVIGKTNGELINGERGNFVNSKDRKEIDECSSEGWAFLCDECQDVRNRQTDR